MIRSADEVPNSLRIPDRHLQASSRILRKEVGKEATYGYRSCGGVGASPLARGHPG